MTKPAINFYWSTDPLYPTPLFGAIMSRNRFQLLLKFLISMIMQKYLEQMTLPRQTFQGTFTAGSSL